MIADCVVIAALDEDRVIGAKGAIPWDIQDDLRRFRDLTMGCPVVVGRRTYQSMPELDGRQMIVLSSDMEHPDDGETIVVSSIHRAVTWAQRLADDKYFVAGGASVYRQFLNRGLVDRMELTLVEGEHNGDTYFPEWDEDDWSCEYMEQRNGYRYVTLE